MKYVLSAICVVFAAACAQMLLKQGARQGYKPWWRQYLNPWVISGYGIMFATMVVNIWCMHSGLELKALSVLESTSYLFVPLLSLLLFKERMTPRKLCAIAIIIVGVVVFFL